MPVLALILILQSCGGSESGGKKARPKSIDARFADYVTAHTGGVISATGEIKVRLAKDNPDSTVVGKTAEGVFSFKPEIKGKTVWADRDLLVFKPSGRLKSGQEYKAKLDLEAVSQAKVPSDLKSFPFSFKVMEQNMEVKVEGLETSSENENALTLTGYVQTADKADDKDIEKVLTAKQPGAELTIGWEHGLSDNRHRFIVSGISRGKKQSAVTLNWKGEAIGVNTSGSKTEDIPAIGDYKVLAVKLLRDGTRYISVRFSDPLRSNQDLRGLISVKGMSKPKFVIAGNELRIYSEGDTQAVVTVTVRQGVKNNAGGKLKKSFTAKVYFEQKKPQVQWVSGHKGTILPGTDGMVMPFEAVGLKAVDVTVYRVFRKNVLQFLQVNSLSGNNQMRRVARPVGRKVVPLNASGVTNLMKWNRFTLDLSEIMDAEPGAVYQVMIGFRKSQSLYNCGYEADEDTHNDDGLTSENWDNPEEESSYWDYSEDYYYSDYNWRDRDNPCTDSYYGRRRSIRKNIFASDLGLIAKRGEKGKLMAFVTDMQTTESVSGVNITLYDYQQQPVGQAQTGSNGMVSVEPKRKPFFLVANKGDQYGYLKLDDGGSLSMSSFDVSGEYVRNGLKGFIYGERGVWRPGDEMHLCFVLEDKNRTLPADHPVVFELSDPKGKVVKRKVSAKSVGGIYDFTVKIDPEAETGRWSARVKVGGAVFTKQIKVETVKPNRLKIELDFHKKRLLSTDGKTEGDLSVRWLHGAVARNLKAEIDLLLVPVKTVFKGYGQYNFDDLSKRFSTEPEELFSGRIDNNGEAKVSFDIKTGSESPGALKAIFKEKVFEEGGDFSIGQNTLPYYPYNVFVGLQIPEGDSRGMLLTDKDHTFNVATVTAEGKPVAKKNLKVEVFKLNWRWWWDNSSNDVANYMGQTNRTPVWTGRVNTGTNGKGSFKYNLKYPAWGRYLIRVHDEEFGHSTSKTVYFDWPGWARKGKGSQLGATMLDFRTDKAKYAPGEKIKLTIPASAKGRALVSVENGSEILNAMWVETEKGTTTAELEVTSEMSPNVYLNVTLVQPHATTANDLPIRLYGVKYVEVVDPATKLNPEISMPEVLRPEAPVKIKVSEKNGKAMAYTLAVVDEGLLDLTRFKTPNPWKRFYAREALGVRTWDMYDMVIGAYGGKIERLLSIGGDEAMRSKSDKSTNRFKPVVKFMGPFFLKAGQTQTHSFDMPRYVGSVRTMVVAASDGAYGSAEATTPVRQELMVLATLPRVMGPGETVKLPVNVFAMSDKIRNVNVKVEASGKLKLMGASTGKVTFQKKGDKVTYFELKAPEELGQAKVKITATSGNLKATYDVELDVRASNPPLSRVRDGILDQGKSVTLDYEPSGIAGTNSLKLEVSSIPAINMEKRLNYLIRYPHGCVEQTTSAAFPQLYVGKLAEISDKQKATLETNINAAIKRLRSFQTADGGLSYWPGGERSNTYGTSYAGHFLVAAQKAGYYVPSDFMDKWKNFQTQKANDWDLDADYRNSDLAQAYRLYTLALAGQPAMGAMNRMRETSGIRDIAKWRLAQAYALAGEKSEALKMVSNLTETVEDYRERSYTFGSASRDRAMILETMASLGERQRALPLLRQVADALGSRRWMSTQTTAYCLLAVAEFVSGDQSQPMKYTYTFNGNEGAVNAETPVSVSTLPADKAGKAVLENKGDKTLFVRLIGEGIPLAGQEKTESRNLKMDVIYKDKDGKLLDPTKIPQGTDFTALVTVSNNGLNTDLKEMALSQIFPSGWEILNMRLNDTEQYYQKAKPTYQDIRDDRVYTYFDLPSGKRKTFAVQLNASYQGKFYLPSVTCGAMYDDEVYAQQAGTWVEVIKQD
ncbi:alpha-2-macroglobulin family protein [Fulvitalea axinellae]